MGNSDKIIGIDLGASSGRCIVGELSDEKLKLNEVHRFTTHNYNSNVGFFWDVDKIFNEIIFGLKKSVELFGNSYSSISIDTWGVDYVLIDESGNKLGDPYHYRDGRTDNAVKDVFNIIPQEELYQLTGTQVQQFNTIFQLHSEKDERLKKASKFLHMPDYFNYMLSGEMRSEYSIASTSGLCDPYKRDWSWDIIERLNLPKNIFSEIVEPGFNLGTISKNISVETGLDENISIVATAGHDTASAVASIPVAENNWAYLSSGTWSLLGLEKKQPIISELGRVKNCTNEGGVEYSTRFLNNLVGLWPVQECRRFWMEEGKEYSFDELKNRALELEKSNKYIDLNDPRFLKAGDMPNKIQSFLRETNQEEAQSDQEIIRIVLENLAKNYKSAINDLKQISGETIEILHAVGGGIKNDFLNQLTADYCNINVVTGPVEGTIIGNIGVQAVTRNLVKDVSEWRGIVLNSFETSIYKPQ